MELFDDTSLAYEKALRFGDYRVANKFTRKEGAGHQDPDFNNLKNMRVTSYELLESTSSPDNHAFYHGKQDITTRNSPTSFREPLLTQLTDFSRNDKLSTTFQTDLLQPMDMTW
jgi:hypothetical protein